MTAPLRICARCQLDALAAAPAGRPRPSISNIRRQSAVLSSQLRSRRAYSDDAANQDPDDGAIPASTANSAPRSEQSEHQQGGTDVSEGSRRFKSKPRPKSTLMAQRPFRQGDSLPDKYLPVATQPARPLDISFKPTLEPGEKPPWALPSDPANCKSFRDLTADDLFQNIYIRGWLVSIGIMSDRLIFGKILQDDKVVQIVYHGDPDFKDPDYLKKTKMHTPVQVYGYLQWKNRMRQSEDFEGIPFLDKVELVIKDVVHIGNPPAKPVVRDAVHSPAKRYLQLRTDQTLAKALRLRSKVSRVCRQHLEEEGFLEVETPLLFKSTPEGAREFLVPTRKPGHAYALPQSPQQYKQILMAGGVHKYYQLAKCFRDEDLRADRQPEFTQLDLEMAFASGQDVMRTVERLLKRLWWEVLGVKLAPFPVLPYHSAISSFGSDKPDLRFEPQILKLGEIIDPCLNFKPAEHNNWSYQIMVIPNVEMSHTKFARMRGELLKPPDDMISPLQGSNPDVVVCYLKDLTALRRIESSLVRLAPYLEQDVKGVRDAAEAMKRRHLLEQNNIVVMGRRRREFNSGGSTPIGTVRKMLASKLVEYDIIPPLTGYKFLWVNRFPLFTRIEKDDIDPGQSGGAGYKSTHHPFTAPLVSDRDKLFVRPWETIGQHYDIVLNGVEIGGGSTRIHEAELQQNILEDILKVPPKKLKLFRHLFEMLDSGCPPHAGLALGFDRLIALMLGTDSIRNVIAFPKNGKGLDPVVNSPGLVTTDSWKEYGLAMLDAGTEQAPKKLEETPMEVEEGEEGEADEVSEEVAIGSAVEETKKAIESSPKTDNVQLEGDVQEQSKVEVKTTPEKDALPRSTESTTQDTESVITDSQLSALRGELSELREQMEKLRNIASGAFAEEKRALEAQREAQALLETGKRGVEQPKSESVAANLKEVEEDKSETQVIVKDAAVEVAPREKAQTQVVVEEAAIVAPQEKSEQLEVESRNAEEDKRESLLVEPQRNTEQRDDEQPAVSSDGEIPTLEPVAGKEDAANNENPEREAQEKEDDERCEQEQTKQISADQDIKISHVNDTDGVDEQDDKSPHRSKDAMVELSGPQGEVAVEEKLLELQDESIKDKVEEKVVDAVQQEASGRTEEGVEDGLEAKVDHELKENVQKMLEDHVEEEAEEKEEMKKKGAEKEPEEVDNKGADTAAVTAEKLDGKI
ncbi:hypothetical protein Dda_8660 [Drechslerella dactyloides]|uniref:Aminoacyl-transfer RNA synthetases class-II family profile domain-containing protein n=1 Tax=Drechslerella dactyloides TaxID=74499 RepID=A0AAD6NG19_DREDA|nr:hypothetical protein Dda_8660 [Drechslerella dactyloides]